MGMKEYTFKKTWTFWPRKCDITRKRMPMFSTAFKGKRVLSSAGELMLLVMWISPEAHMFEKLKGNIK